MFFSIASEANATSSVTIPSWIMWGFIVAAILSAGLILFVSLVAMGITSISGGWQGGSEPWRELDTILKTFVLVLPVSMFASYWWILSGPLIGILAGIAGLAIEYAVWFIAKPRF